MSECPGDLKYTESHEWVRIEENGEVIVGISDHAQHLLGDVVFVELPEVGSENKQSDDVAVIESVKAASDIYMPVSGTVLAVNEALSDSPEVINSDPYGEGWIFKVKLSDATELEGLKSADAYSAIVEAETEE